MGTRIPVRDLLGVISSMRRQTKHSQVAALVVITLLILAACGTKHKTPSRQVRAPQGALAKDSSSLERDTMSTLAQLSSFLPDSSLLDSLALDSTGRRGLRSLDSTAGKDSLFLKLDTPADSLPADSLSAEELARQERRRRAAEGFDDIIAYQAQDSLVLIGQSMAYLFGPSKVDYKDKGLDANFMRLNLDSNQVYAHYVLDSIGKGTAYPKFRDGGESYESKSLNYNFKTSKGFITGAVTQQGEGYITAERTKMVSNNCLFMENGRYSTCDNHDHPHFYFMLTKGKARPQKNVVAGPSYLVIADVPMPIGLPFGFFPFNKSYSSGIIMPKYGEETQRGFYLREGGYYFAFSDYVDLAVTGDWYSLGSWGVNARSNYKKRYRYAGNINLSYLSTKTGERDVAGDFSESRDFRINWSHSQDSKASPNETFSASVNFSTSSYNHNSLNTLYNPRVAGQNTKNSSINYSRSFAGTPFRISASIDATQNSADSMVTMSLPNVSISMNRLYPFKRKKRVGAERWYEKISISYSGQFRNSISTKENLLFKSNLIRDWRNGFSHNIPISASYKLFGYVDLTLSANYNERWYTYKSRREYDATTDRTETKRVYGFNRVFDFSTSASLNTTLYGFFKPWRIFGDKVQMIRHRMTPRVGVSFTPDFGAPMWGYYDRLSYTDKNGTPRVEEYSLYSDGHIFGAPGRGKSASINFGIDNNLEMKVRTKTDSTETFKKISLIDNFSLSSSYNLAADSFQLADINAGITLRLSQSLQLSLSGSFDPYLYGHTTTSDGRVVEHRVNKLRIFNGKGFGSLRGTGTSFNYTLSNETFKKIREFFGGKKKEKGQENKESTSNPNEPTAPTDGRDTSLADMAAKTQGPKKSLFDTGGDDAEYDADGYLKVSIPWSLSLSYGVNLQRTTFDPKRDEYNYGLMHSLMFSGSIQPTKYWSLNFNASYDFIAKKVANMTIGISRDMHCWSLSANAIPFGPYRSYSITIGVKSSLLHDVKWDKHGYSSSTDW